MAVATAVHPSIGLAALTEKQPQKYSSPREAFDAYRTAIAAGDWSTTYNCWTPEIRKVLIFEAYFSLQTQKPDDPGVARILRDFPVDEKAIGREYEKLHSEKYGPPPHKTRQAPQDPAEDKRPDRIAQEPANGVVPGLVPGPPNPQPAKPYSDLGLLHAAVHASVEDKEGFYVAVSKMLASRNPDMKSPIGSLEQLHIQGDRASGTAMTTLYHYEGPQVKKVGQKLKTPFYFRQVGGGWFLDLKAEK